ncbi:MAG: hypothetical protein P4M12_00750 [Gammaproteobacteria bacterium]|nr:hypothetical protein [Gammaproteobacteria bacterium]
MRFHLTPSAYLTPSAFFRLLLVFSVIASYVLFVEIGLPPVKLGNNAKEAKLLFPLEFSITPDSYYQMLSEGFLKGQLSLSMLPAAKLLNLPDPYNSYQNQDFRIVKFFTKENYIYTSYLAHDLSLYHKKFYMYFGPLAAVTFFIPIKLLTNYYPSESLAVIFFLTLGFMMQFLLIIEIKRKYFSSISELWVLVAGLLLGFANNAPFLTRGIFYEVAIASAYCSTSFAIYFLYNIITNNQKIRDIILFSLFISLAGAGRPHFIFLSLLLIPSLIIYFFKTSTRNRFYTFSAALILPALCVGSLLGMYNYLRFGSIYEFGQNYTLLASAEFGGGDSPLFPSEIIRNMTNRFYSYFFQPYHLDYFDFHYNLINLTSGYVGYHIAGVLWTAPVIIFVIFLPKLILVNFKKKDKDILPLLHFLIFFSIIPVAIISFLLLINSACQRYITDFISYLIILAIISIWLLKDSALSKKYHQHLQALFILLASISIIVCYRHGLYMQHAAA